ncbi:30S ribosomal protein S6 [Candidatus Uhrbacteria bacterium]|nr:30S ribosomal protein S6 [Candidatus Uhrbacteria bacterium]
MTRYELLYIIPSTLTDEEVGGVETKVAAIVAKVGASVESTKRLGKFRLAYPIKNQRHGHYVLVMVNAEPSMTAKLDENMRLLSEDVLRHLLLRADEAGSDQKFELVQFTEVNVEQDRPRRREKSEDKDKEGKQEEVKAGVAALESKPSEAGPGPAGEEMSSEELDKKIESALSGDSKDV